jgi:autophagy-related protein 2
MSVLVILHSDQTMTAPIATVEEHAFQRAPEVGPAPDMIYDDLPSNLDYLDESFGTAAGLRELRDDDLDDFDREDLAEFNRASGAGLPQSGIISNVGGETIKIFRTEGLHIVENYFDILPPESDVGNKESAILRCGFFIHAK